MNTPQNPLSVPEFIVLLATTISIVALSTDVMLPALEIIGADLKVPHPNDVQLVVSSLFFGFAFGQILVGPLSDSFGRKPVIYLGFGIFFVGCLMSMFATSWNAMLIGRVLQGLGIAGPRIVSVAIVRDLYEGRAMARIMSFVMAVFILVPAVAPAFGQVLILSGGWRMTFATLLVLGFAACMWLALRQPETLAVTDRRPLSARVLWAALAEVCSYRRTVGYTVVTGLVMGAFLGYLSSAQQIFQTSYGTGQLFAVYFAIAALSIGAASVVNSNIVMRFGMRPLVWWATLITTVLSVAFLGVAMFWSGVPPLWMFMIWLIMVFFCVGLNFSNLNSLAMEPVGHVAGMGAALIGSFSTFISLVFGWPIGHFYNGTVMPLVFGFAALGACSLVLIQWIERRDLMDSGGSVGYHDD